MRNAMKFSINTFDVHNKYVHRHLDLNIITVFDGDSDCINIIITP